MGDWDTNRCAIGHRAGRKLGNCWNWETRSHHHQILVWLQDGTLVWVADRDTNRIMHFNIWSFAIELSEIIHASKVSNESQPPGKTEQTPLNFRRVWLVNTELNTDTYTKYQLCYIKIPKTYPLLILFYAIPYANFDMPHSFYYLHFVTLFFQVFLFKTILQLRFFSCPEQL